VHWRNHQTPLAVRDTGATVTRLWWALAALLLVLWLVVAANATVRARGVRSLRATSAGRRVGLAGDFFDVRVEGNSQARKGLRTRPTPAGLPLTRIPASLPLVWSRNRNREPSTG
jgi:hypothetical protein